MTIRASFFGTLGRDAESKHTPTGKVVVKFSAAINQGYGDNKKTQWVNCDAWGDRYVKLVDYLKKGTKVLVYGSIELEEYTNKEGMQKTNLKCRVNDIELAGSKNESSNDSSPNESNPNVSFNDDVPF